jgi:hypothetical protein
MTLRDWFAGQALAGIMTDETWNNGWNGEAVAKQAYDYADAMLEQSRKP